MRTLEPLQHETTSVEPANFSRQARVMQVGDKSWRAKAPAKLNVGLRVHPVRADGYHDIESWFVPLSWHDTLTYSTPLNPPAAKLEFVVTGRTAGIPTDPTQNLVGKAALALAKAGGVEPNVTIELHKVLPPGGGLGGGSADAALTLVALNLLWKLQFSEERLREIAAGLGSDIPFFVGGVPAICRGRGELIEPMPLGRDLYAVLVVPSKGISTKEVFTAFDASVKSGNLEGVDWHTLAHASAGELNDRITNDLEQPAFLVAPWLREIRDQAATACGQKIHMTGSGSSLFTLCHNSHSADDVSRKLAAELSGNSTCVPVRLLNPR